MQSSIHAIMLRTLRYDLKSLAIVEWQ